MGLPATRSLKRSTPCSPRSAIWTTTRSVSWPHSLRVPLSQAYGVVTFYHYFSLKPPGKHTLTVCAGTACYIKGADKLIAAAEKRLGIPQGQTTNDGQISLMTARCVGACSRAPVVLCDGEVAGEMTGEQMLEQLERWAVE